MMDCKELKELIEALDNSSLTFLELEKDGFKLKMGKEVERVAYETVPRTEERILYKTQESKRMISEESAATEVIISEKIQEGNFSYITSPIVGTFYASSAPGKADFVKIGDKVKKGDTLCIIEAMKLMNDIVSDMDGEIVEILISNEDMVECTQQLFKIKSI
ncbi:acetyl-CoA carboxylase biotin carboxyl carrier protein [Clostridium sp.]|uniref:acetyl-CoA carboxylase biotin carboxyl carrier protein n=1 Tax=Clostridium sp. TaxID=1506 RepID=UPI003217063E